MGWVMLFIVLSFFAGRYVGWIDAHIAVSNECKKLGRFYVGDVVYECSVIKTSEQTKTEKP